MFWKLIVETFRLVSIDSANWECFPKIRIRNLM